MRKSIRTFAMLMVVNLIQLLENHLSDVWGDDTFENAIKSNIDLCFSGKTVQI